MPNYQSGPDLGPVSNLCTAMWLHAMTLLHHIPDAERKWSCKTDGKVVDDDDDDDDDDDAYASWVWISLSIQGFCESCFPWCVSGCPNDATLGLKVQRFQRKTPGSGPTPSDCWSSLGECQRQLGRRYVGSFLSRLFEGLWVCFF